MITKDKNLEAARLERKSFFRYAEAKALRMLLDRYVNIFSYFVHGKSDTWKP